MRKTLWLGRNPILTKRPGVKWLEPFPPIPADEASVLQQRVAVLR